MSSPVYEQQQQQQQVYGQQAHECSICLEMIEGPKNSIVPECGHTFHCSCLMKNVVHNGFGCPLCRFVMAETVDEDDDDDEDIDELDSLNDSEMFDDNALTSFRMLFQRISGEEVEEEPVEEQDDDWSTIDGEERVDPTSLPDSSYITQKLIERGITYEDLVKNILFQEHSSWGTNKYDDYQQRSMEIYGQFRATITQYSRRNRQPIQQEVETQA